MTTQTRNEAAERLLDIVFSGKPASAFDASGLLDEALAAERRATVERLRSMFAAQMTNPDARWCSADEIDAILDEVAAR